MDATRNVVILPDQAILNKAITLSKQATELAAAKNSPNHVMLSPENKCCPHLSLYQFGLPPNRTIAIAPAVYTITQKVKPFTITLQGYKIHRGTGIFWLVKKPYDELHKLHVLLLTALNHFREGVVPRQNWSLFASDSGLTSEQRSMLGRWGYPSALDEYQPHITLADTSEAPNIVDQLPLDLVEMNVTAIHLSEVGPYGTCPGSIETFNLSE